MQYFFLIVYLHKCILLKWVHNYSSTLQGFFIRRLNLLFCRPDSLLLLHLSWKTFFNASNVAHCIFSVPHLVRWKLPASAVSILVYCICCWYCGVHYIGEPTHVMNDPKLLIDCYFYSPCSGCSWPPKMLQWTLRFITSSSTRHNQDDWKSENCRNCTIKTKWWEWWKDQELMLLPKCLRTQNFNFSFFFSLYSDSALNVA